MSFNICVSVESPQLADPVENDTSQNSRTHNGVMVIILTVLLVVSVICVILLTIFVFTLKMQLQADNDKNR